MKHAASGSPRAITDFLVRAARRLDFVAIMEGAAMGVALAAVVVLSAFAAGFRGGRVALVVSGVSLLVAVAARVWYSRRGRGSQSLLARLVEKRAPAPGCRNVLFTATELLQADGGRRSGGPGEPSPVTHPAAGDVRPDIADRVMTDAERATAALNPALLFPARAAAWSLTASVALWLLIVALLSVQPLAPTLLSGAASETAVIRNLVLRVVPPAYTGLDSVLHENPERIEVLVGSRVVVSASGVADSMWSETINGRQSMARLRDGRFSGELIADADGYIAIETVAPDGTVGARRLIGLSVLPDRQPRARIALPGRDLFLPDGRRTITITVQADDDIALNSLALRYTRVSGSGEQFSFTEGAVPITITRASARDWEGYGAWNIGTLGLEPGDMVVYRAVASDSRPNAAPSESDTFIIEIAGPGVLLAGGFSIDDEYDRYAVSQQMVILKSERLLARRDSHPADAYRDESLDIAAEQRKVRAEFIFMMGGELASEVEAEMAGVADLDEHSHAAIDDEAISGRLAHEGRLDIIRAIRSMSHASTALTGALLDSALTHERNALNYLQRAFTRTRYILRTLTERERLDLTRRLTGVLETASRSVRPAVRTAGDSSIVSLRAALSSIASLAASGAVDAEGAARAAGLARSILRENAAVPALQRASVLLNDAAVAMRASRAPDARASLDSAATLVATTIRSRLATSPPPPPSLDQRRLDGLLVESLRRARERR